MAEALAGLGLSANIAQFIGLGMQLLSQGKEIYDSFSGTREAYDDLEVMVTQMETLIEGILQAHRDMRDADDLLEGRNPRPTSLEKEIQKLASQCHPILKKLLSTLSDLKIPKNARFRAWRAFGRTFKHAGKKKEIEELKERLFELDNQLRSKLALLLQLRNGTAIDYVIRKLDEKALQLQAYTDKTLGAYRQEVLDAIQNTSASTLFSRLPQATDQSPLSTINHLLDNAQRIQQHHKVLESLVFESMKDREDRIVDAHLTTLDWIFDPEKTPFVKWLSSDNDIFWVKGKAGSGKSTLMKYLSSHPTMTEQLLLWAKPQRLVTASFFFWIAGLSMQKSQNGLLQSILYQLLAASSDMDLGSLVSRPDEPWGRQELLDALRDVVQHLKSSTKLCFFIDGLDEYDGYEEDIVGLLQDLAASPHIKICLSSRPWNPFIDAFDRGEWKMVVEDLTRADMGKYVHEMMNETDTVTTITKEDITTLELQIVEKAHGVWLWVFLVVRDLLRDICGGEDFAFLQRRLESFPEELEDYFENILFRIDRIHQCDTARIFLEALDSVRPLPVLALKYILLEREDPDVALKLEPGYELDSRDTDPSRWSKLLNSRCRDLMEIQNTRTEILWKDNKIHFLHRTVRDFLQDNYKGQLFQRAGKDFNTHLSLARVNLALAKASIDAEEKDDLSAFFYEIVDDIIHYSVLVEAELGVATTAILDDVDRAGIAMSSLDSHWSNRMPLTGIPRRIEVHRPPIQDDPDGTGITTTISGRQWSSVTAMNHQSEQKRNPEATVISRFHYESKYCNLLALTINAGLFFYVKDKIESDPSCLTSKSGRPLLDYALRPVAKNVVTDIDLRIVRLLLSNGADPNERTKSTDGLTVWHRFLIFCAHHKARAPQHMQDLWFEAAKLMIKHGADMEIEGNNGNYVFSVFEKIFSSGQRSDLETLDLLPLWWKSQPQTPLIWRLLGWK